MMHQERGISMSEINSLYVVLVSANKMKPYFIGITRTHSKVLYAVTWMISFGEDHNFSRIKLYVRSSRTSNSHQERSAFTYLGLQMKQLPNAIRFQQSLYDSDISPIVIQKG